MIYEEKEMNPVTAAVILAVCFVLGYSPWLAGFRDLFSDEGIYATMTGELSGPLPLALLQGELASGSYPLYMILVRGLHDLCGLQMEVAMRTVPLVTLAAIAGIVFLTCIRSRGAQSAAAGAAVVIACMLAADKYSEGSPEMLGVLAVFGAWMCWFDLGAWRGKWKLAWICTGFVAGLGFYAIGWKALILIFLPMLVLRRPLNMWSKPRGIGFAAGLALTAGFILLWGIPRWNCEAAASLRMSYLSLPDIKKYLFHLLYFPFDTAIRFMPWTLFIWAPFCPAIMPLDKNPLLSKYLRTLFLSLFVLLWIAPDFDSMDYLYLMPPLAVLVGLNYWIVVRRYGWKLLNLCAYGAVAALAFGAIGLLFTLVPESRIFSDDIREYRELYSAGFEGTGFIIGVVYSSLAMLVAALTFILAKAKARVWITMSCGFLSFFLTYQACVIPYRAADRVRSETGRTMAAALKLSPDKIKTTTIYKFDTLPAMYSEMCYTGAKVQNVRTVAELPQNAPYVYVLSVVVPSVPERTWKLLYTGSYRNRQHVELWEGKLRTEEDYED